MGIDRGGQQSPERSGPESSFTSTDKAEELIRWYIRTREEERKRNKRLLGAGAAVVIVALLLAGLVELVRIPARGQTAGRSAGQSGPPPSAVSALAAPPAASPSLGQGPPPATAARAPEPSPAANPRARGGSASPAAPPKPTDSAPASRDAGPRAAASGQKQTHSGVIVGVSAGARAITMEELGASAGPGTAPRRRSVRLTSQTRIALTSRSADAPTAEGWLGDFRESPVEATDLRPADFVTVTATESGDELVAQSITVVRPAGDLSKPEEGRARAASEVRGR